MLRKYYKAWLENGHGSLKLFFLVREDTRQFDVVCYANSNLSFSRVRHSTTGSLTKFLALKEVLKSAADLDVRLRSVTAKGKVTSVVQSRVVFGVM